jgi:hypothetical protein
MNSNKPDTKILTIKDWGIGVLIIGVGTMVFARNHPFTMEHSTLVNHVHHVSWIPDKKPEDYIFYTGLGIVVTGTIILIKAYSKKPNTT